MKTTERHHLKDNELAMALNQAQGWLTTNQRTLLVTIGAIVVDRRRRGRLRHLEEQRR